MLPRTLWRQCGLAGSSVVEVRSSQAGLPSALLNIVDHWQPFEADGDKKHPRPVPIPVFTLEPEVVRGWAAVTAHAGSDVSATALLLEPWEPKQRTQATRAADVPDEQEAKDRLSRFRSIASPLARQLAGLLAAAPLRLPVMRVVQRALLPRSGQIHLAEVVLGGLFRTTNPEANPEELEFEFLPHVQDLLLDSILISEAIEVFNEVSNYLAGHLGQSLDFQAIVADPTGRRVLPLAEQSRPFAKIATKLLRRLGGRNVELAEKIEQLALGVMPIPQGSGDETGGRPMPRRREKKNEGEQIKRYQRYLSKMDLNVESDISFGLNGFLNNIIDRFIYSHIKNNYLLSHIKIWIKSLLEMLDCMAQWKDNHWYAEVDVEAGESYAQKMMIHKNINLLWVVPWGSEDSRRAMIHLKERIEEVINKAYSCEFYSLDTYSMISVLKNENPKEFERTPSICLFPFYKAGSKRPYWSIFPFGKQGQLGLIMNNATSYSLLHDRVNPGLYEYRINNDHLLKCALAGLDKISNYDRDMFLNFGDGYAAVEIFAAMMEGQAGTAKTLKFKKMMLVDLTEALNEPTTDNKERAVPTKREEDILGFLRQRRGTRLALITDPGESIYDSLVHNHSKDLVIYQINHDIMFEVGLGFSLGMVPLFLKHPGIVRELANEICEFLIGETEEIQGRRTAIEKEGIKILSNEELKKML